MSTKFDAIVFDCDGTLVDSESIGSKVLYEQAVSYGFSMAFEVFKESFRGRKINLCLEAIEKEIGRSLPGDFLDTYRKRQLEAFRKELVPIEGIPGLLAKVQDLSLPRCVASGAPLYKIQMVLEHTQLKKFFGEKLYSSYELNMWKPEPDLFLHAARNLDTHPERCAVIEDSLVGVEAGIAAGMHVFHYRPREDTETVHSEQVTQVSTVQELQEALGLAP